MKCAIVFLASLSLFAASTRPITHEDLWLMKRTGEPVPSPDGKWIAFSLTEPDYDSAKTVSDLWIVAVDGTAPPRRLTSTRALESGASWSPDSRRIAFSTRREGDETPQIYILPLDGGEAQRVTTLASGALNPRWRPDGKALLFESMVKGERRAPAKSSARVYDAFPVRYWNYWLDESRPHIFVFEMNGKTPTDILAGTALSKSPGLSGLPDPLGSDRSLQAVWSPDGKEIVFSAVINLHESMRVEPESHLFRIKASGGEPSMITVRGQSFSKPTLSPDGKSVYALYQEGPANGRIFSLSRLVRFAWPDAAAPKQLTAEWDRSVESFAISPDSGSVLVGTEDNGFDRFFRLPASGGALQLEADPKEGGYTAPVFAGKSLVARYSSSVYPGEIALLANGERKMLTDFNAGRLAQLELPKPEHFWFTASNGKRIHNLILFPPTLDKAKKYPIVVFPHGGPNSMSKDAFSTRWNMHLLTSPGYVLLQTNYTGSTGFGEKFADDIERDVLRGPAKEILEAIAEAARRYPWIDLSRQAAIGASYGGYLMNWFNGHTRQFRCIVNHAGAANNESQYGSNDGGFFRELRMGAPVWETGKGQWIDQSPIRYAGNWRTPTLITQGELDFRVPLSESITTFKILQRLSVPARLVVFPDEGHWISKGENSRHHMQEVLDWLKKYL
jgi:dipeptidyl aminopeptidase/acylaminoacyl peptidase